MADEEGTSSEDTSVKEHHKQATLSYKRPKYREARWERAVKVYTINLESKYVLVQGVPAVGATKELLELFALYGAIDEYRFLDEYPTEPFTEVYWIKFQKINSARIAKKKLDNRSFFGGILHVCYAPEFETVDDTREKLQERRKIIARKTRELYGTQTRAPFTKTNPTEVSSSTRLAKEQNSAFFESPSSSKRQKSSTIQTGNNKLLSNRPSNEMRPAKSETYTTPSPSNPDFPSLPLPPRHVPWDQFPPPPPPWEFPSVPSAHATLPAYIQYSTPPPPPPPPPELPLQEDTMGHRQAVPVYMSQKMIGPQPEPRTSESSFSRSSLTGNESLDKTVVSVRSKMQMISNSQELSGAPTQNAQVGRHPVGSTTSPVHKKKRKRI